MGDGAPQVGVIMGSQSDWPTMAHAVQILEQFGIAHEVRIVSAHRTPDRLVDYAKSAAGRGLRAIIAGAGGAAHLDRESVVWGTSVSVRVDLAGRRIIQKKKNQIEKVQAPNESAPLITY